MNIDSDMKLEMLGAADLSQKIYKLVMEECPSVGRGILGTAMAYCILAKCSPREIDLSDLVDVLRAAHNLIEDAEQDAAGNHVLQ